MVIKKDVVSIKVNQIQLVLFNPGMAIPDKVKLANNINTIVNGLFDGEPVVIPLPPDAPPELPRILLSSKDGKKKLQASLNRINFIYADGIEPEKFPIPEVFDRFSKIAQFFSTEAMAQTTRVAMVTQWIVELTTGGVNYLLSKYFQSGAPFRNPHELEIHSLTKELIVEFETNQWVRVKSIRKREEPDQNQFLLIEIDINTIAEKVYRFDPELLELFLKSSADVTKEIIQKHFG